MVNDSTPLHPCYCFFSSRATVQIVSMMDPMREDIAVGQDTEVSSGCDVRGEDGKDEDIEAGQKSCSDSSDSSSMPSWPESVYSKDIHRTSTLYDSGINDSGIIGNVITRASGASGAPGDLEAGLDIEFEVKWDGPDDPNNPLNWSLIKKAFILASVSVQTLMVYALPPTILRSPDIANSKQSPLFNFVPFRIPRNDEGIRN